ncbi:MAG: endonuclease/exonuclease/phosphatase family protein [Rikenellaceae bacterium]
MIRVLSLLALILYFGAGVYAKNAHLILFYNVENLFDTKDDPRTKDDDNTPRSKRAYNRKISNISRVLGDVAAEFGAPPTVIALAEVENRSVLEDLVSSPKLSSMTYQIIHYNSPDERGIDVAMLYSPERFQVKGSRAVRSVTPSQPQYRGRDILTVWGDMDGEPSFFIVTHWASRLGGVESTQHLRRSSASQVRSIADSVIARNPQTKVFIMGDMNDNPTDESLHDILKARGHIDSLPPRSYYNPFWAIYNEGYGTTIYKDNWYLFDNIIVSANLLDTNTSGLSLQKSAVDARFYGSIFSRPYLFQRQDYYKHYLWRGYMGGFSDHLPVYVTLE